MTAQSLLATGQPPASDVVEFVGRAEDFYTNLYASLQCRGATPGLLPGQHLFAYFAELVGQLIVVMLADPSAYSTSDVHTLAIAAIRIGVVGNSAPDPQLAEQVRNTLLDALSAKLADAEATRTTGTAPSCRRPPARWASPSWRHRHKHARQPERVPGSPPR